MQSSRKNLAEAWTAFWAEQGPRSRCLASSPELRERLDAHWRGFAASIPAQCNVLDVGCGGGAVGHALIAAQPALRVTGVDIARVPPSNDQRLHLLGETAMEQLPLPDRSFGAAVSQFGYEYGDRQAAAAEVARVLQPGAPLSFLVHHPEGPIVASLRLHRNALHALTDRQVKSAFLAGDPAALRAEITMRQREYPDPIFEWAAPGLLGNAGRSEGERLQRWKAVEDALAPELLMLNSFDLIGPEGNREIDELTQPFSGLFQLDPAKVLRTDEGEPVAWVISGKRLG